MPIYQEMHSRSYDFLIIFIIDWCQNYGIKKIICEHVDVNFVAQYVNI